jgi:hypothetical protein
MNCKPGDLAIVVKAEADLNWLGRVVEVVRPNFADSWITDPLPVGFTCIADEALRPIRDQPGADETLSWIPVPTTKEPA